MDEAAIVWDYYFSGLRRKADGSIVDEGSRIPRKGDAFAIAVSAGSETAWVANKRVKMKVPAIQWQKLKYHGLNGDQKVRGEYLCVPISFIAQVFGLEYTLSLIHILFRSKCVVCDLMWFLSGQCVFAGNG